jgi:hypothetical protein
MSKGKRGRPGQFDEPTKPIQFRLPVSQVQWVKEEAEKRQTTTSKLASDALEKERESNKGE